MTEIHEEFQRKASTLAAALASSDDWQVPSANANVKRLVALLWPHITRYDRSKFVAYLDNEWLYNPPANLDPVELADLELTRILEHWKEVLPGLEGQDLQFAQDVEKRRKWRKWKPSEKQVEWIKALWASRVEVEEGHELEVTE